VADLYAKRALDADAYLANAGDVLNGLFRSALHLGDYAQARSWCERGKRTTVADAKFVECDLTLMVYENARPQPARAWAIVQTLAQLDPPERARASGSPYNPIHRRILASIVSARAGDRGRALAELARARSDVARDAGLGTDLLLDEAVLWHALGFRDSSSVRMERYIAARGYRQFLEMDPLYAPIVAATAAAPATRQARGNRPPSPSGVRQLP
jgi:hypothetical protein